MNLVSYRPFNFVPESRLFRSLINDACCENGSCRTEATWSPRLDVKEDEGAYRIFTDVPGVDPKEIELTFEDGVLTIQGEKKTEATEEKDGYRKVERVSGQFVRQLRLPDDVDTDAITATGKNGVLEIVVPKTEKAKPKKIAIQ